jgi:hypothetical protein
MSFSLTYPAIFDTHNYRSATIALSSPDVLKATTEKSK